MVAEVASRPAPGPLAWGRVAFTATVIALVGALLSMPPSARSHSGGLDKYGCHTNRRTGDYHCHRAPAVPPSGAAPLRQPSSPSSPPAGTPREPAPKGGIAPAAKAPDPYAKCKLIKDQAERLRCFDGAASHEETKRATK